MRLTNRSIHGGVALLTLVWCSASIPAQQVLWQTDADEKTPGYGEALAVFPDQDGDGIDDVLVGYTGKNCNSWSGMIYLLSGADGSEIWNMCGGDGDGGCVFGTSIAVLDDLDLDGVPEFAVGDQLFDNYHNGDNSAGGAFIYSGATLQLRNEFIGEDQENRFGFAVRLIADIDADGFDDLIVSAPSFSWFSPYGAGRVYVYSSATGALLRTHDGEKDYDFFGGLIARITDLDSDGVDEYAISSKLTTSTNYGQSEVFSGASGNLLFQWEGDHFSGFGLTVDAGDLNSDGVIDVLITNSGLASESGYVHAYSGADASELFTIRGTSVDDKFGISCCNVGDLNADGVDEFLVGAYSDDQFGTSAGSATLFSGSTARPLFVFSPGYSSGLFGKSVESGSDFNNDGLPDFMIVANQTPPIRMGGRVTVYAGNDLYLQAQETVVQVNDSVVLETRGGETGALTVLVLVDVSGTPMFAPLQVSTFDANGESVLNATVPSSASGLDFTLIAYAQKKAGGRGIIDSWTEVVTVE